MSDPVLISLIGNGATILTLIITRYMSRMENKAAAAKIEDIHKATNGMKEQLERVAYEKGVAEGHKNP